MDYRKCLEDATLLVEEAGRDLEEVKTLYDSSMKGNKINARLSVKIKSVLEHLRSSLDFVAHALVIKYSPKRPRRIYFPYANLNTTREKFVSERKIEQAIPGLESLRPDLADVILKMQHFSDPRAKWFPEFMELNNKNKHVHLVPHGVSQGVCLEADRNKIMVKSLVLSEGARIVTSIGVLEGPLSITPQNVHEFNGFGVFKAEIWEGIFIDGYGFPNNSYEFVSHCVNAISSIVKMFSEAVP